MNQGDQLRAKGEEMTQKFKKSKNMSSYVKNLFITLVEDSKKDFGRNYCNELLQ